MQKSFKRIVHNIKEVILEPKTFWEKQKQEQPSQMKLLTGYFLPLLLLVALGVFASEMLRGSRFYITFPLMKASREIVLFLLQYVISAFLTNELIKAFGGEKNMHTARKLVVYSLTPYLLVSFVTGLFPFLYVANILGLYGFYIFWTGVSELLVFPEKKQSSYILVTILANFFVFSFLSVLLSRLLTAFL
ncbi:Yip1 family protein [Mariniphaga sediminis]|uniref:Yip1 family protein n=1 Tax=Mariniphaga sediminis TaxID=1628158 RepID=UPI0035679B54